MIFDYFKKFVPNKTNFDMSNHSPYTAKMGELLPTYVNDVMAGDDWQMRLKESIKTAPLDVPSFLRISNSSHAFFVPNSTIWEHWNDFVTNGSMLQDVVLTSSQKSEVASRFKVPSIPANLLQIPLKIAKGWACPYYTFSKNGSSTRLLGAAVGGVTRNTTTSKPKTYFLPSVTIENDAEELLINAGIKSVSIFNDNNELVANCYQCNEESMSLMENYRPHSDSGLFTFSDFKAADYLRWICFQDEFSATCDITDSPVEYTEFDRVFYNAFVRGDMPSAYSPFRVKCGSYRIRDKWLSKNIPSSLRTSEYILSDAEGTFENDVRSVLFGDTAFIGSVDVMADYNNVGTIRNVGVKTFFTSYSEFVKYLLTDVNNYVKDNSLSVNGLTLNFKDKSGNVVKSVECAVVLRSVSVNHSTTSYLNSNCLMRNPFVSNMADSYFFDLPFPAFGGTWSDMVDIEDGLPDGNTDFMVNGHTFLFSGISTSEISDCLACGYSPTAWMHYLCEKVSRLVDFMDINIDGLVVRGYVPFLDVFYNALPFMGYSKIWHTYYRNSQIQSPELCYKDSNGPLFLNSAHNNESLSFGIDIGNTADETNFYHVNDNGFTGWYLTIHNKPLEMVGGYATIKIDSLQKAFTLITGCCMSSLIGNFSDKAFDGVFLPSYYNSLCGVKYKNIGKSIFTSSMLEPTNGAKIEEIPDTVLELRFSEKLQQFWERTAVARTFKKWSQTIFGTTPSHDDYDEPLLLGKATSDVQIGEILQQSQTTDTGALGQRAGVAVGGSRKGISSHYFNEHGFVFILSAFSMEVEFCDGEQGYTHATRSYLDIPYTQFASIGNESIPNRLLSAVPPPSQLIWSRNLGYLPEHFSDSQRYGSSSSLLGNACMLDTDARHFIPSGVLNSWNMQDLPVTDSGKINTSKYLDKPFAYTSRYADKKIKLDRCHGEFRNQLNHWVAFQRFLGSVAFTHFFCTWEFKADNNDLARYFVVTDEDMFQVDRYNECNVKRALPYSSRPQ